MRKFISALSVALAWTGLSVHSANAACPTSYKQIDTALWIDARDSGDPARWVQYLVSAQCPDNKPAARALLTPLLGNPGVANSAAVDRILLKGKFSGDQSLFDEEARNGLPLTSHRGGAELYTFQLFSAVRIAKDGLPIPRTLYEKLAPELPRDTPKDVALWVRYRCQVHNTGSFVGPFGDPKSATSTPEVCNAGTSGYVFRLVEPQLMGPYAKFFEIATTSRPAGSGGAAELTLTLKLKEQYSSFMSMLTGGFVNR